MAQVAIASENERFEAAVKIITGLPKDGPFQPSNEMKLKFYGLYKQATFGPCTTKQPGFWDAINRAKWTAWKSLGDMSRDDAMRNYVENLKQVIETMTLDDNVQDFLEKIGPLYEFVTDDGKVVSKHADLSNFNFDKNALETLGLANGGAPLSMSNGNSIPGKDGKKRKDESLPNGKVPRDDSMDDDHVRSLTAKSGNSVASSIDVLSVRPADSADAAGSDEEVFDDASDSQAFAVLSVRVDKTPLKEHSSDSHSPLSSGSTRRESKAVQSDEDTILLNGSQSLVGGMNFMNLLSTVNLFSALSPSRQRAASAVGQLLRELPEMDSSAQPSPTTDSVVKAWAVINRIQAQQARRARMDDDWLMRRLVRSKHGKGKKKSRGHRGEDNGDNPRGRNEGQDGGGSNNGNGGGGSGAPIQQGSNGGGESSANRVHRRQASNESGSSSKSNSSDDSVCLEFDPHVGAVLLRMHRELQHINRQLELMEGILITQQHMVRTAITSSHQTQQKVRLWFFTNLPWRTIVFIVAWPVVVNFCVRYALYRLRIRRRR